MRPNNIAKQHTILQSIPAFVKRSGGLFIISSRMQSRTIIVYPILGIPWRFFQTFVIKNSVPQGNFRAGPLLGEKRNEWQPRSPGTTCYEWRESKPGEFRRRLTLFLPICKPRRHRLLNGFPGILGMSLVCFSPGETAFPQGKTGRTPVFYKMEGRENSLPSTELFDCTELYCSISGSDHLIRCVDKSVRTYLPVSGFSLSPVLEEVFSSVTVFSSSSTSEIA